MEVSMIQKKCSSALKITKFGPTWNPKSFATPLLLALIALFLLFWGFNFNPQNGQNVPSKKFVYGPDGHIYPVDPIFEAEQPKRAKIRAIQAEWYGTQDYVETLVFQSQFHRRNSATIYDDHLNHFAKYNAGGSNPYFIAPIHLPVGAEILFVEFVYYDNSTTYDFTGMYCYAWVSSDGTNPGSTCPQVVQPSGSGGDKITLLMVQDRFLPRKDVNQDGIKEEVVYFLAVNLPPTNQIRLKWAVVGWVREVSPAPKTATFSDVPKTHPAFQYVEALVASGIVQGCGNGKYCPKQYVTRGQMAVYLSLTLGLHWSWWYP